MHAALQEELSGIVTPLPPLQGKTVLDLGSGDGFFAALFAEAGATVTALDNCGPYLKWAASRYSDKGIHFLHGDACDLPFPDRYFDVVWSAYCMQSFTNLPQVIREVRRVLKPGGTFAILETDNIHSVMLPWPPDVEIAVRQAEYESMVSTDRFIGTYFPRHANDLLKSCGFRRLTSIQTLIERRGTQSAALQKYLVLYLRNLVLEVSGRLDPWTYHRLQNALNPKSKEYVLRNSGFFFRSLESLILAKRA